jgi:S-adenosylmethionine:tRNA ribosyltransferase-isomerase
MQNHETLSTPILTSDFDYDLPPELIAQTPVEPRDASRLLVLERETGTIHHTTFAEIGAFLRSGDLLVLNDSRVLAARLLGERVPTGGRVEALLVREAAPGRWEALLRPGSRLRAGQELRFSRGESTLNAHVETWLEDGICLLAFHDPSVRPDLLGSVPLPPYIEAHLADPERYQTVYADELGSVAAPTAGLHFTPELLNQLRQQGIETAFLTLHVGPATFRPVHAEDAREHPMHAEYYRLTQGAAAQLSRARREGRRVIAVGTTSVRVLEQVGSGLRGTDVPPSEGWTRLLILPGHRFRVLDGLITNFHLPRSTLLMLVSALAGREQVLAAYREAIAQRYRFYSIGDAMLIL